MRGPPEECLLVLLELLLQPLQFAQYISAETAGALDNFFRFRDVF